VGLNGLHRLPSRLPSTYLSLAGFGNVYACGEFPHKDTGVRVDIQDTVGCGHDWEKESVFFTLNGKIVPGSTIMSVRGKLFPMLKIADDSAVLRANLGGRPFVYEPANTPNSHLHSVQ
jgi:hypothetical protein